MKTRCKVTCDLEKISYTDKRKNYPQYIFCNERLDMCRCVTLQLHMSIRFFWRFFAALLTRFEDMTSVVRVTSVKRLKCVVPVMCVALLARVFSLTSRENRDCKEWTSCDESIPSEECCRRSECSF